MEKTRTGTETVGGQVADRIRPRNCIKKNGDGDRTANMSCQEQQNRQGQWSTGPCPSHCTQYKNLWTRTGRVKNNDRKATYFSKGHAGKNKDNIKHRQDKAREKEEEEGKEQERGQGKGQGQGQGKGQGTGTSKRTRKGSRKKTRKGSIERTRTGPWKGTKTEQKEYRQKERGKDKGKGLGTDKSKKRDLERGMDRDMDRDLNKDRGRGTA